MRLPKARHNPFVRGFLCGLVYVALLLGWLCLIWFVTAYAHAEGAPPITLPDQVKEIATGSGSLERPLLGLTFTTIGVLFTLLMKSGSDRRADADKASLAQQAAIAVAEKEHVAALKEKDEQHAEDRAKWHADTTLLQEARVGLLREVMQALTNATLSIQNTQTIIAERSNTSAELTASVRELVGAVQAHRTTSEADIARLTNRIKTVLDELADRPTAIRGGS